MANPVRRAYKSVRFHCFVTVLPLRWWLDDVNAQGVFSDYHSDSASDWGGGKFDTNPLSSLLENGSGSLGTGTWVTLDLGIVECTERIPSIIEHFCVIYQKALYNVSHNFQSKKWSDGY